MKISKPFFSIVIPTYNRANLIANTIQSALNQTYNAFEIIVIDDGSTDETEKIVKELFGDKITYIKTPNQERGSARNVGGSEASGDYLYFLDSDDMLYPYHLKEAEKFIKRQNRPQWFFQEYEVVRGWKKSSIEYNRTNPVKTLISDGNFMSCHGVFIRNDIFKINPFNEDRELAGSEDYELWLRMAARYPLKINPIVTSALEEHDERSVFHFDPDTLIKRKQKMLNYALKDKQVNKAFGKYKSKLESSAASYIALHVALTGTKKGLAFKWWLKSIVKDPLSIVSLRSFAILKHLILQAK